jgi:hypothetical protein
MSSHEPTPNNALPPSNVTMTLDLPDDVPSISRVDYWTERRLTIKPTRVKVSYNATLARRRDGRDTEAGWHIFVEGRVIRQSDGQLTTHRRGLIFGYVRTRVSDALIDEGHIDPLIVDFAHDARRRITLAVSDEAAR